MSITVSDENDVPPTTGAALAPTYLNPKRHELHAWMHRQAPPLADLYAAAVELMYGAPLPARPRLVAHAVREIANRLPDALGAKRTSRFDTTARLDTLAERWEDTLASTAIPSTMLTARTPSDPAPEVVAVPVTLLRDMKELLSDWNASRQTAPQRARELFLALAPENHSSPQTLEPIIRQWVAISDYFVGVAHESLKSLPGEDDLTEKFELFEWSLGNLVGSFYQGLDVLDEILETANS